MTENVVDQTTPEQEPTSPAGTEVSGSDGAQLSQQGSTSDSVNREEFNKVVNELRGLQSRQDKSTHEFNSRVEQIMDTLGVNLSPEQKQQLELIKLRDEVAEMKASGGNGAPTSSAAEPDQGGVNFLKAAEKAGIDLNSLSQEEQFELFEESKKHTSQVDLANALFAKRVEMPAKTTPTPGSVISTPTTTSVPTPNNLTALRTEYEKRRDELIKEGAIHDLHIALKKEFREKGLKNLY